MSSLISDDEIKHEVELVWLEDTDNLDYVRQALDRLPTRGTKPPYFRDGRLVGYAVLGPNAKASRASGTFRRRVFFLQPHDRDSIPDGLYEKSGPSEGIDPRTAAPGVRGHKTLRSDPPSEDEIEELGMTLPL